MLFRHILNTHRSPTLLPSLLLGRHVRYNATQTPLAKGPNEEILKMLRSGEQRVVLGCWGVRTGQLTSRLAFSVERDAEVNQTYPNPFKVTAFSNAIEAIAQIRETIKSGDDLVLEVRFRFVIAFSLLF